MLVPSSRVADTAARLSLAALTVLLVALGAPTPARAHNSLRWAEPARDATLETAPTVITLEFTERLDPTFTTIVLSDAGRQRVATATAVVAGARGAVTLGTPLGNGTYTVAYRVVSADGHPVQGSYRFTVADPRAGANPTGGSESSSTPASSGGVASSGTPLSAGGAESAGGPGARPGAAAAAGPGAAGLVGAGALVALVVSAGAVWWRRRPR